MNPDLLLPNRQTVYGDIVSHSRDVDLIDYGVYLAPDTVFDGKRAIKTVVRYTIDPEIYDDKLKQLLVDFAKWEKDQPESDAGLGI